MCEDFFHDIIIYVTPTSLQYYTSATTTTTVGVAPCARESRGAVQGSFGHLSNADGVWARGVTCFAQAQSDCL